VSIKSNNLWLNFKYLWLAALTKQALKEGALTISLDSYQLGGTGCKVKVIILTVRFEMQHD